ncbi:SAM-dependent methyltransferase [Amycolatopsis alba DSM 44262]|uniref:SAM-dependent methyltransferase n=2 Tax=Amycolatopsis alba TaxID=76020 RepID=A0A229REX1_AMYAL|nr:class I SAM-dependent methyltransferase [Amycolatopsis alba]OXM45200.1 SAM-dependent methyltransferase [Amycolatopsis alba DSM 44262]
MPNCRVCGENLREFLDFGSQPLSDAFRRPADPGDEFFFRLAVGSCTSCSMVQLMEEVPRDRMFHHDYPYHSSGSSVMRKHFERTARDFLETELAAPDSFAVELGCNDGIMLRTIGDAGRRHLGVEPSGGVAEIARANGVRVRTDFFEHSVAVDIHREDGPANVIYAANTMCHIPYAESIFEGVAALLAEDGVFVFEDPYLGDIVKQTSFDQIYDEHFYFFSVRSVQALARRFGFELVDVERLPVHGGEVRYTIARAGRREPAPSVAELADEELTLGLHEPATLDAFAVRVREIRDELVALLEGLRAQGRTVVGYGATAKSATVLNYCGIGPGLVSSIVDTTPAKQGRVTPGSHIPVRPADTFGEPYPDVALLFAWNHADEIMAKEQAFRAAGGKWILYVPKPRLV